MGLGYGKWCPLLYALSVDDARTARGVILPALTCGSVLSHFVSS